MAVLRFPKEERKIDGEQAIRSELAALGIDYERWNLDGLVLTLLPRRFSRPIRAKLKR